MESTPPAERLAARARGLDERHAGADRRSAFHLPDGVVYLDGNSLGALPKAVPEAVVDATTRQWGERLIRSWNESDWWGAPERVGDRIAGLVGAAPGQLVVTDTTSANLFKVLIAASRMHPWRTRVLTDPDSFPTDLYILESAARLTGFTVEQIHPERAAERIAKLGDKLALVAYSSVDYRTGELWDLASITHEAHRVGAFACWDLCHSAGAVDVRLDDEGADFAVGCSYKYLNGGPGAPAWLYVRTEHQETFHNPVAGWNGHARPFAMEREYDAAPSISRGRSGTSPMLSLLALEAALTAYDGLAMADVRARSLSLTGFFLECLTALGINLPVATPVDEARRGSQVSLRHPQGYAVVQALTARGVIGDYREPDIIRLGFAPLYVSHEDAVTAAQQLADVVQAREFEREEFARRAMVT
jgi:kynureninase